MFWPLPDSPAFSDALVGYAPAGLVGHGVHAAIARYDLLFLFAYALCFAGAYLLARKLSANKAGAVVAGAAFAYAPWRLEQEGHLHIISSGAIPLALFLLLRGYRRSSARTILAGWVVATWQFSLGFSLGLRSPTCSPAAPPPSRSPGGARDRRGHRATCSSPPPPGWSAWRSSPACSRARTCGSSTTCATTPQWTCRRTTPIRTASLRSAARLSGANSCRG
jgi:hypothetical protein